MIKRLFLVLIICVGAFGAAKADPSTVSIKTSDDLKKYSFYSNTFEIGDPAVWKDGSVSVHNLLAGSYDLNGNAVSCSYVCGVIVLWDKNRSIVWASAAKGEGGTGFFTVSKASDGFYVGGYQYGKQQYSYSINASVQGDSDNANLTVIKYDNNGNALWARVMGSSQQPYSLYASEVPDGTVYGAGLVTTAGKKPELFAKLAQFSKDGNLLWQTTLKSIPAAKHSINVYPDGIFAEGFDIKDLKNRW